MSSSHAPIVLVGVPGSGTTSVGREIAATLGLELRDTERLTAAALGFEEVSSAFVVAGEEAFRSAEEQVALGELAAVAGDANRVVVLGSGVLASERVREAAAAVGVVELAVTLAHAAPRLGLSLARPVFLGNPRAQWSRLAEVRRAQYQPVVAVTIDTDDAEIPEVAARVVTAMRTRNAKETADE